MPVFLVHISISAVSKWPFSVGSHVDHSGSEEFLLFRFPVCELCLDHVFKKLKRRVNPPGAGASPSAFVYLKGVEVVIAKSSLFERVVRIGSDDVSQEFDFSVCYAV